jgi:tRNA-splicing ligase RtcB
MMAVHTTLQASDLGEDLRPLREAIERAVPHGRTNDGRKGDKGTWADPPARVREACGGGRSSPDAAARAWW